MTTATMKPETETKSGDLLREEKSADTLAARIAGVAPKLAKKFTADRILEWSDQERKAVTKLLDVPPDSLDGIVMSVVDAMGQAAATNLAFAAIRKQRDTLQRREGVVIEAESHVAELADELAELNAEMDALREQRKDKEKEHAAAVLILRRSIKDQECGQNNLPFEPPKPSAGNEPAKTTDAADQTPIEYLRLGKRITNGMREADIKTVGALIKFIQTDEWWHRKIKGVGESSVDAITDALTEWRSAHPVEGDEEE